MVCRYRKPVSVTPSAGGDGLEGERGKEYVRVFGVIIGVVGAEEIMGTGATRLGSCERTRSRMPSSSCVWSGAEKHFC